jgi:trans-aconitate methyltransferase
VQWDAGAYDADFGFVTDYGSPLLDLLDVAAPASVLDVGCGTGIHAGAMAARGLEVVGVDLDPQMLERARREYPDMRFVSADVETLDLGRTFDAAFSNAALHWMTDQPAALSRIRVHLVTGAAFVAEMGGKDNVAIVDAALEEAVRELDLDVPPIRKFFPSVAQESALLEAAGFDISLMQWFPRPTRLAPGRTAADWTRMFRSDVWAEVPPRDVDELASRIDSACKDRLQDDDGWFIDYHRLRFVCHAR